MYKLNLNKKEKDVIANVLIDNAVSGVLLDKHKDIAHDIAEEMLVNEENSFWLQKHEVILITNSLLRYKNRYTYEEELGEQCVLLNDKMIEVFYRGR